MEMNWKDILNQSIRDMDGLRKCMKMSEAEAAQMAEIIEKYPLCVNPYYFSLINKDDPADPIRKMCIPDIHEFSEGGQADTSGEADNTVIQGMQHKYAQTALIVSTNQCAMYCRHCFRKRMVGASSEEVAKQLPAMADYVRSHKEINNVLISGGDAFMNSNETIEKYLRYFTDIPTLDFIRFGTRIPVVLPQRLTQDDELLRILESYGEKKQIIIVTQFNHPRELTPEAVQAVRMLQNVGCIIITNEVRKKRGNTMDYTALANELLSVRANLLQVPASQQISKMVKGELFVLNYLATHEKIIHPKELSEKMAVSTARIASLLNHMESKKLILRYADKDDNRQVIVILTEEGKQEIHRIRAEVIAYVCAMLESLGPEDAEAYIRIQKKIWNNFLANH